MIDLNAARWVNSSGATVAARWVMNAKARLFPLALKMVAFEKVRGHDCTMNLSLEK
jgi:hypothetical protein